MGLHRGQNGQRTFSDLRDDWLATFEPKTRKSEIRANQHGSVEIEASITRVYSLFEGGILRICWPNICGFLLFFDTVTINFLGETTYSP